MTLRPTARESNIHIRAHLANKELIDRAAEATGKTRSEFILQSAHDKAHEIILDQRVLVLTPEAFNAFTAALDRPLACNPGLQTLFNRRAPWDQ